MKITSIKTRIVNPPKDDLYQILDTYLPKNISEKSIICITSKIISICQGRCELKKDWQDKKDELIKRESELWLDRKEAPPYNPMVTVVNGLLKTGAGIDASNSGDYYVLLPDKPFQSAQVIHKYLKEKYKLKELGIIITDSRSLFSIRGSVGQCLGFAGFNPLIDYRKTTDLFGRELHVSVSNIAEALAVAGVLSMGEGSESTPISIIEDIKKIEFDNKDYSKDFIVDMEEDYYGAFLKNLPWEKGGKGSNI